MIPSLRFLKDYGHTPGKKASPRSLYPSRGNVLLETIIAITVLGIVGLTTLSMMQRTMVLTKSNKSRLNCDQTLDAAFTQVNNMPFRDLFNVDSSTTNFGLPACFQATLSKSVQPYSNLQSLVQASGFTSYKIGIQYMYRDTSDLLSTGYITGLRPYVFTSNNNPPYYYIDYWDPSISYYNYGSGCFPYYSSVGISTQSYISEAPNSRIKQADITIFKNGKSMCRRSGMVSMDNLVGGADDSSSLILNLSTPAVGGIIYDKHNASLSNSRNLALFYNYPAATVALQERADSSVDLVGGGATTPLAEACIWVSGGTHGNDSSLSDAAGIFSDNLSHVTNDLSEGLQSIIAIACKPSCGTCNYNSPYTYRNVLYDIRPSTVVTGTEIPAPGANPVITLAPYISIEMADFPKTPSAATTTATSGIDPDVVALKINGSTVSFTTVVDNTLFRSDTTWPGLKIINLSTSTLTLPVLPSGLTTVSVEFGDYAGYKSSYTWTFTLGINAGGGAPPSIAGQLPAAGSTVASNTPTIQANITDGNSGVDYRFVTLQIDGTTYVNNANIGNYYTPFSNSSGGLLSYTPTAGLASGAHTVLISAKNFSGTASPVNASWQWTFNVP